MPSLRRLVPAAAALVALGALLPPLCAAAPAPPAPPQSATVSLPPALSREWKRLPSDEFTIVGTSSAKDLAQLAVELETFLAVLQQMTPSLRLASQVPTYVVALKDFGAFTSFQPRNQKGRRVEWVAGYFSPGADGNYLVAPWGGKDRQSLAVMLHELTHHVVSRNVRGVPTWIAEGVAEFYSTFRIDADRNLAIVGEPVKNRLRSLVGKSLMPMDRFFAVTSTYEFSDSPVELELFYAQSWALVHYLFLGEQGARTRQIGTYLQALERGQERPAAFTLAFGSTYDELGKDLVKYVRDLEFPFLKLKPAGPGGMAADASRVEPMSEADAEALQAVLLMRVGAVGEAEAALGRALAQPPSNLQTRIALDRVRRQLGQSGDEAAQYEQLAALASKAAAVKPLDASTQFYLSMAALAAGKEAESDAALEAAVRLNPDADMLRQRAYAAFALGNDAVAAKDVRAYFQAPVWESESAPYVAFLGALALRRLKQDDEAARLLVKAATVVPGGTWTSKVLDYMQGKTAAAAFLASASNDGERTEVHTYVGFDDVLAGRRAEAIAHFRWVKDKGSRNFVEYPIAVAELNRLEASRSK
jgi:lipoprotein NlpI